MLNAGVLGPDFLAEAWVCAAELVRRRPWLTISWVAHPGLGPHLVVHDGPTGPALHFDDEEGPTFAGRDGAVSLDWDEVLGEGARWHFEWGPADADAALTPKSAAYELLRTFAVWGAPWSVQPARYIGDDADPLSIYELRSVFPTANRAIDWYVDVLRAQYREGQVAGRAEYWHEPMWLVCEADAPLALVDEAGQVHTTAQPRSAPYELDMAETVAQRAIEIQRVAEMLARGAQLAEITEGARRRTSDIVADLVRVAERQAGVAPARSATVPSRRRRQVFIDFASIFDDHDWALIQKASGVTDSGGLAAMAAKGFSAAFGPDWWNGALRRVEYEFTLFIGSDEHRTDLLRLASGLTGFFFGGGRLLVARLGELRGCDVFVTRRGDLPEFADATTQVIMVGSPERPDWNALAWRLGRV